ncbi:MAG: WG repeat-containing protein [Saprospiraceae bacterium]
MYRGQLPVLLMRFIAAHICWIFLLSCPLQGQGHFPVKINKKWGLIDANGQMVLAANYDAIGEFKKYGYAVMQKEGRVGLLNEKGIEIIAAQYDDLKVLDSTLVAVMDAGEWMVVNLKEEVILPKGYDRVEVWSNQFIAYVRQDKWGIMGRNGKAILPADFDEISQEKDHFITRKSNALGVYTYKGVLILPNLAAEIRFFSDSLIFFRKGFQWGAVDGKGEERITPRFDSFERLSPRFIKLIADNQNYVFSLPCNRIITKGFFDDFYPFTRKLLIVKEKRQLGLIDQCGQTVLPAQYDEIQTYGEDYFRVNQAGKWGVVTKNGTPVIPMIYDYIAPLRSQICLVKKDEFFGIVNAHGEEVVMPIYHRIELGDKQAKAYLKKENKAADEVLTLLSFDKDGRLLENSNFTNHFTVKIKGKNAIDPNAIADANDFLLTDFEWFYSPEVDRWGLRRLADGEIQIEPKFHYIKIERDLGFTVVGIKKDLRYEFERTTFRFDMVYGVVKNEVGLLISEMNFWDINFEDFREGQPLARCLFSDGTFGLMDKIGRIVAADYAFIGAFQEGVARMSRKGRISGSMKRTYGIAKLNSFLSGIMVSSSMVDYTKYDQLFQQEAVLICHECEWGYLDTMANVTVPPRYTFAQDMVNKVGIVQCGQKWGLMENSGKELVPCEYDGVQFLENTENKIIKVYKEEPKYGLIDTLGELKVNATYDEIGHFSEGRLAVKRQEMWGFVNVDGIEIIPCRFQEVQNFSDGWAAVKLGNKWGFIDRQGDVVIDFKYRRAGSFQDGLAWVYSKNKVGYIDQSETFVIAPTFDKAFDFQKGIARVMIEGQYGLIDKTGNYILRPSRYTDIEAFNQFGVAKVSYGNKKIRYGLINRNGQKITNLDYLQISPFSEGLAVVKYKASYGFIDVRGKLVIPCEYSKASDFRFGLAAAYKDGQCGYIAYTGDVSIPFEFSRCQDFDGDRAVVYQGLKNAGLVDLSGKIILEPGVDRLLRFREGRGLVRDNKLRFYYITEKSDLYNGYYQKAREFQHGVAVVQINERWGIINRKGIEVIPPKYDRIDHFENGYAKVRIEGFNGLINLKGELIVEPDYEFISYAGEGLFRVEQGDKVGYFDAQGRWVWDLSR